jgi:hypothetical protein
MANECQTNILFESSNEGIKWLKEKFEEVLKLKGEDRFNYIVENFGVEGDTTMDKLGCKC